MHLSPSALSTYTTRWDKIGNRRMRDFQQQYALGDEFLWVWPASGLIQSNNANDQQERPIYCSHSLIVEAAKRFAYFGAR